ncbi:MAG: SpoIIE family protein phosphatase [Planctomycetes bacterium]|nr:SpoIIE family protein phosphatase [Planctomycetota bacterium]
MAGPFYDFEQPDPFAPRRPPEPAEEGQPGRLPICRRCAWPALSRVADLMSGCFFDLRKTLEAVIDTAVSITHAQRGCLLLYTEEEGFKVAVARGLDAKDLDAADFKPSSTVIRRVRERGDALCIPNLYQSPFAQTDSVLELRLLAVMCAPLILKTEGVLVPPEGLPSLEIPTFGGILGVLYVDSTSVTRDWSEALLDVFQALSDNATMSLINARLFDHYRRHQDLRQSLDLARVVQEKLLPSRAPRLAGFDIAGWSKPCESAGGDYFDYIPLPDHRLALVIGDVSGHGMGAALLMATVRASLLTLLQYHQDPREVLARLNNVVRKDAAGKFFVTLFLGILDHAHRTFSFVNAGHEHPTLYRRREGRIEHLVANGTALGFVHDARYDLSPEVRLEDGDVLLLTTDGMWEMRNAAGDPLGREALDRLVSETHGDPAGDILEILRHAAIFHLGDLPPEDDMTAVVLKVAPPAAAPAADDAVAAGLAALRVENHDLAIESFEKAVLADQTPDLARFYLGLACCDKGNWSRARDEFRLAQQLNPELPNLAAFLRLATERAAGGPIAP